MGRLAGRHALITGGTSGIGLATARLFAAEGASVIVCGSSPGSVEAAQAILGPDHLAIVCDVASVASIEAMMAAARDRFTHLDIVFANAGITLYKPISDVTEADFDRMLAVNTRGQFFTVQKALPLMRRGGVVILTGSIASKLGQRTMSAYAVSKAAARTLAQNLSADLLDQGIRVLCLTPGPTDTPIFRKGGLSEADARKTLQAVSARVPIGRAGRAEEIAQAALFLASDASSFMLGAEIVVDGGKSQL